MALFQSGPYSAQIQRALRALLASANTWVTAQIVRITGIGTTSTDGLVLENTTDAAAGAQQYSPRLRFRGEGWKTDATAGSQTVDYIIEAQPVQGTSAPTGNLVLRASINGGAFSTVGTFTSGGGLTLAGGPLTLNGTINAGVAGDIGWTGRSYMRSTSNGVWRLLNNAGTNTYDITLAEWGTTRTAEAQSVASDGVLFLGAAPLGLVTVTVAEDGSVGQCELRGTFNATRLDHTAGGLFTVTKDNASTINIYYDAAGASGAGYYIQNKRGATRSLRVILDGV